MKETFGITLYPVPPPPIVILPTDVGVIRPEGTVPAIVTLVTLPFVKTAVPVPPDVHVPVNETAGADE